MTNQKTDPNQSLIVLAIFLVVVGVGWSWYSLVPKLAETRTELETKTAIGKGYKLDIEKLQSASTQLKSEKARLQSRGVDFVSLRTTYPLVEDVPGLYLLMEDLTKPRNDIAKISYTIGQPVLNDTSTGVVIPITLTGTGVYEKLRGYIDEVQHALRPLTVTKLSFNQGGQTSTDPVPTEPAKVPEEEVASEAYTMNLTAYVRAHALSSAYAPATEQQPTL